MKYWSVCELVGGLVDMCAGCCVHACLYGWQGERGSSDEGWYRVRGGLDRHVCASEISVRG